MSHCKKDNTTKQATFKLIKRNSYYIDTSNGLSIYINNGTNKPLNGYYVVGDKFKKWEEFNVKNGLLHGQSIVFHKNGEIFSISNYSNGKLDGEEKKYTLFGKLSRLNTYRNGVKYGKSLSFFENGDIKHEAKIQDGEIIESTTFNSIGDIKSQMFIKEGRKIKQHIKAGTVIFEEISSTYDNFEATKIYNEDGSLKLFIQTLSDGYNDFIIERDKNGKEIKRVNLKENPQEANKYKQLFNGFI
ncbi:toxin-antitoxin system YwqK family antitoxin [Tamlana sp. I1]|uniref:toxin-antitoxin system YwqK family antitoxin n=1 Tax=Tamlana sp. I1 TaxID=2762061 RepID=UPI00188F341C|nr:hypothetical protein [Tamlana sp. I1]